MREKFGNVVKDLPLKIIPGAFIPDIINYLL